ncbi:alcC, partial [Yersinia pestis PY-113]
MLVGS